MNKNNTIINKKGGYILKEYHEYFVAFLDILGFKSLLNNTKCDDIYSIFEVLHKKTNSRRNQNGVEIKAYHHIKHTILSDSVIVYIRSDIDDAFAALIDICNQLQSSLANREKPILLRGGINKIKLSANIIVPIMLTVIVINSLKNITPNNVNIAAIVVIITKLIIPVLLISLIASMTIR